MKKAVKRKLVKPAPKTEIAILKGELATVEKQIKAEEARIATRVKPRTVKRVKR